MVLSPVQCDTPSDTELSEGIPRVYYKNCVLWSLVTPGPYAVAYIRVTRRRSLAVQVHIGSQPPISLPILCSMALVTYHNVMSVFSRAIAHLETLESTPFPVRSSTHVVPP